MGLESRRKRTRMDGVLANTKVCNITKFIINKKYKNYNLTAKFKNSEPIMSIHAMLIQSLKHKATLAKLSILLMTSFILAGCYGLDCALTNTGTGETYLCPKINGAETDPVNYILPVNDGDYDLSALQFSVEFPNGLPLKSNTVIKLNGVDVTSDFNDWGIGLTNHARVTLAINQTNTPLINSAIRDGRNSFQVTTPLKAVIFFTVDIPGAEVHFTSLNDGWTGETFRIDRSCGGDVCTHDVGGVTTANRIYTPKRGYLDGEGYIDGEGYSNISQMCINTYTLSSAGVQTPLNSSKGAPFTNAGYTMCNTSALGSTTNTGGYYLDFGQPDYTSIGEFETPVVGAGNYIHYPNAVIGDGWQSTGIYLIGAGTGPWGSPAIPKGAQIAGIQGANKMSRTISAVGGSEYRMNLSAAQRNSNATFQRIGVYVDSVSKGTIQPAAGGAFYATSGFSLGVLAAGDHTLELRGLNPNGGDNTVFVDDIRIWNVSAAPNYNFSFRVRDTGNNNTNYNENEVDVIEVAVTDDFGVHKTQWLRSNVPLWDSRMANQGGLSISFDQVAMISTGIGAADLVNGMIIAGFGKPVIDAGSGIKVTELYFGNDSTISVTIPTQNNATTGRIHVDANLETRVYVPGFAVCTALYTNSRNAYVRYIADVDININKSVTPYVTNTVLNNASLDLGALQGGGILCGSAVSLFQGPIETQVTTIIQNTVGGFVANDLPTLRAKILIEVPDVEGSRDFGPYYFPIQPEVSAFYALPKGGAGIDPNITKWGLMLGLHTRGSNAVSNPQPGQRNVSMGIKWHGVPAAASVALLADKAVDERTPAKGTTLGATLTEDFINAILTGLWESGLVYFDFAFSMPPVVAGNAVLNNLRFTVATQQPWEIDLFPDGTPDGDAQLFFPDLVIQVIGDAVYPEPKTNYNIATMLSDVYFNINLDASPDGKSLRISVADTVQVDVKSVSSDWDNTSEAELIYILDQAFTTLSANFSIDIPFPEILSSKVAIKSVKTNAAATAIQVPIDIYNPGVFPNGPDNPMFGYTFQTINGSNGDTGWINLTNGVDDPYSAATNPGFYPFHLTGNGRSQGTKCTKDAGYVQLGCQASFQYWSQTPFEWGFRHTFNGDFTISAIKIDKRNDCCANRANNVYAKLYLNGGFVQELGPLSQSGTGIETLSLGTPRLIDRVDYVVKPTGVANCSGESCPTSLGEGLGKTGDGSNIINMSEIDYVFVPIP